MNLLFRGVTSVDGYQERILNNLYDAGMFTKCIDVTQSEEYTLIEKKFESVRYHAPQNIAEVGDIVIDINSCIPLDRNILEKMLPFKSTALKLLDRQTEYDAIDFQQREYEYIYNLRYWNHVIEKEKVDKMLFLYQPHGISDYIIYCIGVIKEIPIIVLGFTIFKNRFAIGNSLENMGENIYQRYVELKDESADVHLSEYFQKYYDNQVNTNHVLQNSERRKIIRQKKDILFMRCIKPTYFGKHLYRDMRHFCYGIKHMDKKAMDAALYNINRDFHIYFKTLKRYLNTSNIRYYNRIAENFDSNKKYIYFALQQTPEATTLPLAGVFENQLLSIQMLAYSAQKFGVEVYVKEHYVQLVREKDFYKELRRIPNVRLIKTTDDTYQVICGAIAVATQTGSCIWEGIIRKKNALVFGTCCFWKGAPGVHFINSVEKCQNVIKRILEGKDEINEYDVTKYLEAIDQKTVETFLVPDRETIQEIGMDNCVNNVSNAVKEYWGKNAN